MGVHNAKKLAFKALGTLILCGLFSNLSADEAFSRYVDAEGVIKFPEGFRTSMVHLGSWFVPEGPASGFHDVYTEKATVETFQKTGKFPDGATLVKELRASKSGDYTTGSGVSHSTSELKQWFVRSRTARGVTKTAHSGAMAGVGHFLNLAARTPMPQAITRPIAWAATSLPRPMTGCTPKPIPF